MRMESPLNQRLRRSPPDVVYTPIDVTSGPYRTALRADLLRDADEVSMIAPWQSACELLHSSCLTRYREERKRGRDVLDAIARQPKIATANRTRVFQPASRVVLAAVGNLSIIPSNIFQLPGNRGDTGSSCSGVGGDDAPYPRFSLSWVIR